MEACSCGRIPVTGDRYCSHCGAARSTYARSGNAPSANAPFGDHPSVYPGREDGAELIGSTEAVSSPARTRLMVYGVLLLAAGLVGLVRWTGEQTVVTPEAAAAQNSDSDSDSGSGSGSGSEDAVDGAGPPVDDKSRPLADEEGQDRSVAEPRSDRSSSAGSSAVESLPSGLTAGGSLVGETTGLGLIIGRRPFTNMQLLDLDTGRTHRLAAQGEPVGILGSKVVFRRDQRVMLADLATADDTGTGLSNGTGGWVNIASITGDRLWATPDGRSGPDGRLLVGYDATGDPVDEVVVPRGYTTFGQDPDARLIQNTGGIYRRTGDDFERVSTATLVLAGERLVLVDECDDRMGCGRRWYDRSQWDQPLQLPIPDLPSQGWASIQGADRWIVVMDSTTGTRQLHDIVTGRAVRTIGQMGSVGQGGVALSADGRWLVERDGAAMEIIDLDTGTAWPFAGVPIDPRSVVIFVDLDRVGFLTP